MATIVVIYSLLSLSRMCHVCHKYCWYSNGIKKKKKRNALTWVHYISKRKLWVVGKTSFIFFLILDFSKADIIVSRYFNNVVNQPANSLDNRPLPDVWPSPDDQKSGAVGNIQLSNSRYSLDCHHTDVKKDDFTPTVRKRIKRYSKVQQKRLKEKCICPVIIWDFGGQDIFYSTHQIFLSYRAIYLLILDGSRTLDDPCTFTQYLPGKSGQKTARGIP